MTGLPNRHLFLDRLRRSFVRAKRHPDYRYAVLLIDVDGFKELNATAGEAVADRVLIEAGCRIQACLRDNDTVARPTSKLPSDDPLLPRSGGDEFAVLLESVSDPSDAMRTAKRIQAAVGEPFGVERHQVRASLSIGIVLSTNAQDGLEELLEDADIALHRAKALGRARCEVFDEGMHLQAVNRLKVESELRQAIDSGQFPLLYQPVVNLKTSQIAGFEALLRWQHPDQGMILPGRFFEVAEAAGLAVYLGKSVIREACKQVLAWQSLSPTALNMTVNLSAKQFRNAELVRDIRSAIQESRIDPFRLRLEISESAIMADPDFTVDTLAQLKHVGVGISIGDFGTSQSSLSLLRRLPIDELKIDRSLVATMLTDRVSRDIAALIITLAGNLGLRTVAEGIETSLQMNRLVALGCEFGQGYFFSAPAEARTAEQLLREESLGKTAGKVR